MSRYKFPGQVSIIGQVESLIAKDSFPHTILLTGIKGSPLLAFAIQIAKLLLVRTLEEPLKMVAERKAEQLIHPDLHFSFPVKGSKEDSNQFLSKFREFIGENPFRSLEDWGNHISSTSGNLNINVKECNNIHHKLSLKSFEGGSKIMLIWGAEYLGSNGNRLLKLLEEPPADTFIILVAEDQQKILPTVTSRCQMFKLKPVPKDELAAWLVSDYGQAPPRAGDISNLADGSVIGALKLLDEHTDDQVMSFEDWLIAIKNADFDGILTLSETFRSLDKEAQIYFLKTNLGKLRQAHFFPDSYKRIFARLDQDLFDIDFVENTSIILNGMIDNLERNAHASMLFTASSMKMWRWMRSR